MVLPSLPDLPSKQTEIPSIPGLPDLTTAPPPAPPPPSNLSFGVSPPPPPPPPDTPATVVLQPCPTCGARLTVNAEDVGAHVECPMCKTVFQGQAAPTPTVVTPVPPPPPAPADVDIAPCPKCRAELTVSETDLGLDVECPHCQTVYKAERPQPKPGTQLARSTRRPDAPPLPSRGGDDPDKKKPYEFKPKKKSKDSPFAEDDDDEDDDDDDDRPRRRKKKKRRRSRSRSYDDYDDDRYRSYSPHDGGTMLIWAIVGLLCCWFISIYVLIKSSQSINEIRNGTMDPSGRGLLEAARIIAIIDLILVVVSIVLRVTNAVAWGASNY
jgi:phage FluMu protein Com